jgi:hypothetical protein
MRFERLAAYSLLFGIGLLWSLLVVTVLPYITTIFFGKNLIVFGGYPLIQTIVNLMLLVLPTVFILSGMAVLVKIASCIPNEQESLLNQRKNERRIATRELNIVSGFEHYTNIPPETKSRYTKLESLKCKTFNPPEDVQIAMGKKSDPTKAEEKEYKSRWESL